jgi:hypothetical protein
VIEILLGALVAVGLVIAACVFRLGTIVASAVYSQAEIVEAIWATTGFTQSEWKKRKSEVRLAEHEQESWDRFQRGDTRR